MNICGGGVVGVRKWIERVFGKAPLRFSHRGPSHVGGPVKGVELQLLERQTKAAETNVRATIALTSAMLLVATLQWCTSQSTAAIERAKVLPRFKVAIDYDDAAAVDFLPKALAVSATSGVSVLNEAAPRQVGLLHYGSDRLKLSGICRVSFENYFSFGTNFTQWTQSDAMAALFTQLSAQKNDPHLSFQPVSTIIQVKFEDIYGKDAYRDLDVSAGTTTEIKGDPRRRNGWANIELFVSERQEDGAPVIFRVSDRQTTQDCADALRVLQSVPGVYVGKRYALMSGRSGLIQFGYDRYLTNAENALITRDFPRPLRR